MWRSWIPRDAFGGFHPVLPPVRFLPDDFLNWGHILTLSLTTTWSLNPHFKRKRLRLLVLSILFPLSSRSSRTTPNPTLHPRSAGRPATHTPGMVSHKESSRVPPPCAARIGPCWRPAPGEESTFPCKVSAGPISPASAPQQPFRRTGDPDREHIYSEPREHRRRRRTPHRAGRQSGTHRLPRRTPPRAHRSPVRRRAQDDHPDPLELPLRGHHRRRSRPPHHHRYGPRPEPPHKLRRQGQEARSLHHPRPQALRLHQAPARGRDLDQAHGQPLGPDPRRTLQHQDGRHGPRQLPPGPRVPPPAAASASPSRRSRA